MHYFNLLVMEEFYQLIIEETNKYAEEVFFSKEGYSCSHISQGKPLNKSGVEDICGINSSHGNNTSTKHTWSLEGRLTILFQMPF